MSIARLPRSALNRLAGAAAPSRAAGLAPLAAGPLSSRPPIAVSPSPLPSPRLHASRRSFSSSPVRSFPASSASSPDGPSDAAYLLHYHPLPPSHLALSFLETPPRSLQSATHIGTLPLETAEGASLADFVDNPRFRASLDRAIQAALVDDGGEQILKMAAEGRGEGWIHITDERNTRLSQRIGDSSDLIGSVYVRDGLLQPETYMPMPSYRALTADGPTQLSPSLHAKLIDVLKKIHDEEEATFGASED